MLLLFAMSVGILAYIYAGYPLLLKLFVWARGPKPIRRADITPSLSLVISAYNEAQVIAGKLDNATSLDYPAGALEIVVVSDASSDGTDEIVARYADRGVRLVRQNERRGKTAGLNRVLPLLRGDIVVFSDANAIYERDALRMLARNFADPKVGCVTGEARYLDGGRAAADLGERTYWNYEIQVKRLETATGSMVGGDGAIYAIRRSLWRELPEDAINDFLNPLQIVVAGWRAVYEPQAICHEETAGGTATEYRRRVRIVSRSWRAVFQARQALNPFRVGLFAWKLASHKVLRWFTGVFAALAAAGLAGMTVEAFGPWALMVAVLVVLSSAIVPRLQSTGSLLAYFAAVNIASLIGIARGTAGHVSGVWSTPREATAAPDTDAGLQVPAGRLFLLVMGILFVAGSLVLLQHRAVEQVFAICAALVVYIYVGYPLLLQALRPITSKPVRKADIEPSVSVLIAANDEEAVIEAKIQNTLALDYPPDRLEIVIASDGSVDRTNAIVQRYAPYGVRLVDLSPRRGKMAALNVGMSLVTGEIVVFSDANTFLRRDAVRALVRSFADEHVGAVSGDVTLVGERAALGFSEDLYYWYERWIQHAESEIGSMVGADGALYAVRRRLYVPPPEDTVLDDMAVPMAVVRSGHRVVFEPDARAHEEGSSTAREEFARKSRVIAGAMQFLMRRDSSVPLGSFQVSLSLVSHKGLRWMSPVFGVGAFLCSVSLASSSYGYAAAATAQGLIFAFGVAGCSPRLRRHALVAVANYFCLVQAAAMFGFIRGISGRQSAQWRRFARARSVSPAEAHQ